MVRESLTFEVLSRKLAQLDWVFKYKLYHLPFWALYHYLWWALYMGSAWEAANNLLLLPTGIKFSFYVIFQAIGVYFNLYFLIPRYLERGRYVQYIGYLLLTIVCTASFIVLGYYVGARFSDRDIKELFNLRSSSFFFLFKSNTLDSTMASMALAMSIKLTKNWIESKRKQELLEKEKLETELKFLKSQFNPHFLFNTINSIFVLIHKNPDMASESLAKFSNLLRYQLYECNEQQIPLAHELAYLENFIELERLRQDENFEIEVQIEQGNSQLMIAPFILMPFVENAFKHISPSKNQRNWVQLGLKLDQNQLQFEIVNSVSSSYYATPALLDYGGIGLKNVQRRLDLIYPDQFDLNIQEKEDLFQVNLRLNLQQQMVFDLTK